MRNQLLSGVRILDLSHMLAGPYGTMLLADLGAEVIKIEPPPRGDPMRGMGPHFLAGESAYFLSINRNKKSLVLDLKAEEGKRVFYDLVKVSDVVYDNFRPGILKKLACDYETLKEINPRIICCSISGFGQTGPYRDRPAFDLALQAITGAMSITGEPGRMPVRMGIPMGDLSGGMFAAFAVCAALYQRERTGQGGAIDLSLMDTTISLLTYVAQYYFADGVVPEPFGSSHASVVPYQAFETKDGCLVVAAFAEKFWQGLCRALGLEELIEDPRFLNNDLRRENKEALLPVLEEAFKAKTTDQWLEILEKEGVPSAPINTLDRVFEDPQVLARHMKVEVDHSAIGKLPMIGNPVKISGVAEKEMAPPPTLGQHVEEVLAGILGYAEEKIADLRAKGIV
ncbi:MAG: CaiB/BaiF CoA transferase family protein [Anaerolineae bacterium]